MINECVRERHVHDVLLLERPAWVVVFLERHAVSVSDCRDVLAQHGAMSSASQVKRKYGAQSSLNGSVGISLHHVCFNPALRIVDSGHVGTVMSV